MTIRKTAKHCAYDRFACYPGPVLDTITSMRTTATTRLAMLRELPSVPVRYGYFVYFLWSGDELLYVGQASNLVVRLSCHISNHVPFDRATYHEYASNSDMQTAEALYILGLSPPRNKTVTRKYEGYAMPTPI